MSEPLKTLRDYLLEMKLETDEQAFAEAERFLNEPVGLSSVVVRCHCGWCEYFSSYSESPSACPACAANLVIRNQTDTNEIIYPVVTTN